MTFEERAKVDTVTAKLTGARFAAKQRPIPPFDWYVWDSKEKTAIVYCASHREALIMVAWENKQRGF